MASRVTLWGKMLNDFLQQKRFVSETTSFLEKVSLYVETSVSKNL